MRPQFCFTFKPRRPLTHENMAIKQCKPHINNSIEANQSLAAQTETGGQL